MDRRQLYNVVAELLPRVGGGRKLLDLVAEAMRDGDCRQIEELEPILRDDDALGQIYQAINAPALEAAYRGTARERRKFAEAEIPAVTQLFTPRWVVEFLLQNTLGKLWLEWHPDSALRNKWKWICSSWRGSTELAEVSWRLGGSKNFLPPRRQERQGNAKRVEEIRICDPACGTMNFGLVALEMLREMYLEEGFAGDVDQAIVRNNLVGFDIDPVAVELGRRSLEIKIGKPIREHRLVVGDALFGDVAEKFDVVVTNPPYLSARNLDPEVVKRLKKRYPAGWRDLYSCFILRAMQMLEPGGRAGILTMQSFMFTAAFERMRREIAEGAMVETVAHFGPGLFAVGNPGTLQTAAVVLRRKPCEESTARFYRVVDEGDKCGTLEELIRTRKTPTLALPRSTRGGDKTFEIEQRELAAMPRGAWMYWISAEVRRAFETLPKLGEIAPPRQGLATTDNARFVRYWWEVEEPGFCGERKRWVPYAKAGRFRRWYELARHRVNWEEDGREIKASIVERYPYLNGDWQWVAKNSAWYGKAGITYSYLTSGRFSARQMEKGTIFDVAGSALFPQDSLAMLGVLNSSVAGTLLAAINPTVNFQVGDLRQLPVPKNFPDELREEVKGAIEWTKRLDRFDETSADFEEPEGWDGEEGGELRRRIAGAEAKIDGIVAELYGTADSTPSPTLPRITGGGGKKERAARWISFAVGVWLGRWGDSSEGDAAMLSPMDERLGRDIVGILEERAGTKAAVEIVGEVGGLERFLAREFLAWHNAMYRNRPVIWGFLSGEKIVAVSSLSEGAVRAGFLRIGEKVPRGWGRWVDDGIQINLAPLCGWIAEGKLRRVLTEMAADLEGGRYGFSQTARWITGKTSRGSSGGCAPVPSVLRRGKADLCPGQ